MIRTLTVMLTVLSTLAIPALADAPTPASRPASDWPRTLAPADGFHTAGQSTVAEPLNTPTACYAAAAQKTFFVYVAPDDTNQASAGITMVACYDHQTGELARPRKLVTRPGTAGSKSTGAVLTLDGQGYLWIFDPRGPVGARLFKSTAPYSIDAFEAFDHPAFHAPSDANGNDVLTCPQLWHVPGKGFLLLSRQGLTASVDGQTWDTRQPLVKPADEGNFVLISGLHKNKVGLAFSVTPEAASRQTKLYYLETRDLGRTWTDMTGRKVELPLTDVPAGALVRDYGTGSQRLFLKDLNFDGRGFPVVLFLTGRGFEAGSQSGFRKWTTARWVGNQWEANSLLLADDNDDAGCLHVEKRGRLWRLIAPTLLGRTLPPQAPQPFKPGGEMIMWTSENAGRIWRPLSLTSTSPRNHNRACRPLDAHDDFCAFWSETATAQTTPGRLFFATREGKVFMLPEKITGESAPPIPVLLETNQP